MSAIPAILTLVSLVFIVISLGLLLFKSKRLAGKKWLAASIIGFIASVTGFTMMSNEEARQLGFETNADLIEAKKAGLTDPVAWRDLKSARIELERKATAEKIEAERLAAEKKAAEAQRVAAEKAAEAQRVEQEKRAAEAASKRALEVARQAEEDRCRADLKCWGEKFSIEATAPCRTGVERAARIDFKWNDGILEPKFSHYRWKNRDRGILTFIGDKVQFQNGFGAWIRHTYECDYDPANKTVLGVRAREGKL